MTAQGEYDKQIGNSMINDGGRGGLRGRAEKLLSRRAGLIYLLGWLAVLSGLYKVSFKGNSPPRSDGLYYYSVTASLLWDGDLFLDNQYDAALPYAPGQTVTNRVYYTDQRTGRAFSFFNPGTGFFMWPTALLGRLRNRWSGGPERDAFDPYFQFHAGYAAVLVTALSFFLLFLILREYFSMAAALVLPPLIFAGTNWGFYFLIFPNWSHVYSLFCNVLLVWTGLRLFKRPAAARAALFGLAAGLAYSTRNFNLLPAGLIGLIWLAGLWKDKAVGLSRRLLLPLLVGVCLLAGAFPQLALKRIQHGSFLGSAYRAAQADPSAAAFIRDEPWVEGLVPSNLHLLKTTLFNRENGLFFTHPLYLLGLLGLLFFKHRDRSFQSVIHALMLSLLVFWFFDAAYYDTWFTRAAGAGLGHRRFVAFLAPFLFGLAFLFQKAGGRKFLRGACALVTGLTVTSGALLTLLFVRDIEAVARHRESFLTLHGFLLGRPLAWLSAALLAAALFFALRSRPAAALTRRRSIPAVAGITAVCLLPLFLFRTDDDNLRRRHFLRDGFFLLSDLNPFVRLDARSWRFPVEGSRRLAASRGAWVLPAPLRAGDCLLLKIQLPDEAAGGTRLLLFSGKEPIGTLRLHAGRRIYRLEFREPPRRPRRIEVEVAGPAAGTVRFCEGRIIYREFNRPVRQYLDWVKLEGDEIVASGWALDDRPLRSVRLEAWIDGEKEPILLGEAERRPDSFQLRPDLEAVFVLTPELDRAVTEFHFHLPERLKGTDWTCRMETISEDGEQVLSRSLRPESGR